MIKICYIPHGNADFALIRGVSKFLEREDVKFSFVAKTKDILERCKELGLDGYWFGEIFDRQTILSSEELFRLDLRYGPPAIHALANSDIYLRGFLPKHLAANRENLVARAYAFWEKFFDAQDIDYVIATDTDSLPARSARVVAQRRNRPDVWKLMTLGLGPGYFSLCDVGEEYCWSELLTVLEGEPRMPTSKERHAVTDFIRTHMDWRSKPSIPAHWRVSMLRRAFGFTKRLIKARKEKLRGDSFGEAMENYAAIKLFNKSWYRYVTSSVFRYDKTRDERFVYFPISFKNEQRNLASDHYWAHNQLSLISEVAASLPAGVKLYVKEHPFAYGDTSLRWLRNVQKMPNVRIVDRSLSGQALIDRCEAVVTVFSTTGWEAYLSRKPIVKLGSPIYFSRSRLVYKVGNVAELPAVLFAAIKNGSKIYDENESEWYRFIYSVITTCGKYGVMPEDKCEKIAQYIGEKIKRGKK